MDNPEVILQHPLWEGPRKFKYEHAMNILELEKIHPSGIVLVEDSPIEIKLDAAVDPGNSGNSDKKAKRRQRDNS
jgi:hypothetical protein